MVPVHANIQVQDNLPGQSTVVLASITSSEPASGPAADVQEAQYGSSDSDFLLLRAERSGAGSGRVYKITYTAADEAGNKTSAVVSVVVPHDQSGK
jgi:Tfp pilus assembly protein PilX